MTWKLNRTGRAVPFLDVNIGNPFWAHGGFWTRTDGDAATRLTSTGEHGSVCNFLIDGTVRPEKTYGFPDRDLCEEVEAVDLVEVSDVPATALVDVDFSEIDARRKKVKNFVRHYITSTRRLKK